MTVQDIRTILRLAHQQGLSVREIGLRLKLSKTTIATYLYRALEAGLNHWRLPAGRDDDATLEAALFQRVGRPPLDLQEPDWARVATLLAESGATVPQIVSITGHMMQSATRILERYLSMTPALSKSAMTAFENASATRFANQMQTRAD